MDVQQSKQPPDDDDVARIFRDNDDLGDDSSFFLRAARQLFVDQSPIGDMHLLATGPTVESQLPLGIFTNTKRDRLVFWPALAKGLKMEVDGDIVKVFDHITLEFPKEKVHLTAYGPDGNKVYYGKSLGTFRYPDTSLSLWFTMLVKVEVLKNQDTLLQRKLFGGPEQQKRITDWFTSFANGLSRNFTARPIDNVDFDYIYYAIYLGPHSITKDQLPPSPDLLPDNFLESEVDGWDAEAKYQILVSQFKVAERELLIATACPPGTLRKPVAVHIPRRPS